MYNFELVVHSNMLQCRQYALVRSISIGNHKNAFNYTKKTHRSKQQDEQYNYIVVLSNRQRESKIIPTISLFSCLHKQAYLVSLLCAIFEFLYGTGKIVIVCTHSHACVTHMSAILYRLVQLIAVKFQSWGSFHEKFKESNFEIPNLDILKF